MAVKDLRDERGRLTQEASDILKRAADEKRDMTADEQTRFDALHDEADRKKAMIVRLERQSDVERELESVPTPERRPDANGGEPAEYRNLVSYMNGSGERRPSAVATIPNASEDDKIEAMKTWLLAGSDYRTHLTPGQVEHARRLGYDVNMRQIDIRLSHRPPKSLAKAEGWDYRVAQGVATGPIGLFTVPNETMRALEVALLTFGGMRQACTVIRTGSGAALPFPTVNDTTQSGVLLAENVAATEAGVTFGQMVLNSYKYSSKYVLVSVELLQDSSINVAEFLGSALGTRIGRITNRDFTLGTGSANPNGIVNAATLGKTGATGQQASVIYADLVDLEHSVDPAYRAGARFMMHDQSLKVIKKLVDSQGRPLWMPGLVGGAPDTILGYPFTINQDLATMATSAKSILFGDFSKYIIRDVAEVSVLRLDERFAEFHQVAFLAFARVDGDLLDAGTNPIKWYANT
jgi:HK97 family phage major capsid protein